MKILSVDPGNKDSAVCLFDFESSRPDIALKASNSEIETYIESLASQNAFTFIVVEMVGHYGTGMPAGQEVFDTCVEIGRITKLVEHYGKNAKLIRRPTVKTELCGTPRAKDSNVIQALKDRFGDKGTKKNPGFFYGFKSDCWQAFACGVAWRDMEIRRIENGNSTD